MGPKKRTNAVESVRNVGVAYERGESLSRDKVAAILLDRQWYRDSDKPRYQREQNEARSHTIRLAPLHEIADRGAADLADPRVADRATDVAYRSAAIFAESRLRSTVTDIEKFCLVDDDEEDAMSRLGDELNAALNANDFERADALMRLLDPTKLTPAVIVVALTVTSHVQNRDLLPSRNSFLQKSETELRKQLGEARADALLNRRR